MNMIYLYACFMTSSIEAIYKLINKDTKKPKIAQPSTHTEQRKRKNNSRMSKLG